VPIIKVEKKVRKANENVELNIDMSFSNYPSAVYAATVALTLMLLISIRSASAQEGSAGHPDSKDIGVSSATVDDTTLKETAKAYVKVRAIVQTAQQAIDGTNDNAAKQHIAEQVESRKLAAVKSEGLQPQQYNQVLYLVKADKQLQQKFLSYANQVKNGAD
jgi:Domain of unknown function (DUF4168)